MLKSFNKSLKNRKPLLVLSFENMDLKCDKLKIYKLDNYENDAYDFCIKNGLDYKCMQEINNMIKNMITKEQNPKKSQNLINNNNLKSTKLQMYNKTNIIKNNENIDQNIYNNYYNNSNDSNCTFSYNRLRNYNACKPYNSLITNNSINLVEFEKNKYNNFKNKSGFENDNQINNSNNKNDIFQSFKYLLGKTNENNSNINDLNYLKDNNKNEDKNICEKKIKLNKKDLILKKKFEKININVKRPNLSKFILNSKNANYNKGKKKYNINIKYFNQNELSCKKKAFNNDENSNKIDKKRSIVYFNNINGIKNKNKGIYSLISNNLYNTKNINQINKYFSKNQNNSKPILKIEQSKIKFSNIRNNTESENTQDNIISPKLNNSTQIHNHDIKKKFLKYSEKYFINNKNVKFINIKKNLDKKSNRIQYYPFYMNNRKKNTIKSDSNILKVKKNRICDKTQTQSTTKNSTRFEKLYNDRIEIEENFRKLKNQFDQKYTYKPKINKFSSFFKINESFNERLKSYNNKSKEKLLKIQLENEMKMEKNETFKPLINTEKNKKLIKDFKNKNASYHSQNNLYDKLYSYRIKHEENIKKLNEKIYDLEINDHIKNNSKTNEIIRQKKLNSFKKIFKLLDTDEDNKISGFNVNVENLPITIQKILKPIFKELKSEGESLNEYEFVFICQKFYNILDYEKRRELINFEEIEKNKKKKKLLERINNFSFRPKINRCITEYNGNNFSHFLYLNKNNISNIHNNISELKNKRVKSSEINKNILLTNKYLSKNYLTYNYKKENAYSREIKISNISLPNIMNNYPFSKDLNYNEILFQEDKFNRINNTPKNNLLNIGFDFSNISRTSNTNYMPLKISL